MKNELNFRPYAESLTRVDPALDYSLGSLAVLECLLRCLRQGIVENFVVQAYYDYGGLLYATAPVHEVVAEEPDTELSQSPASSSKARAAVAVCRPAFDPMGLRLSAEEQTFEVTMDFSGCNADQAWVLRKASTGSN